MTPQNVDILAKLIRGLIVRGVFWGVFAGVIILSDFLTRPNGITLWL